MARVKKSQIFSLVFLYADYMKKYFHRLMERTISNSSALSHSNETSLAISFEGVHKNTLRVLDAISLDEASFHFTHLH